MCNFFQIYTKNVMKATRRSLVQSKSENLKFLFLIFLY